MSKKLLESLPEFASDLSQDQYNEILSALEESVGKDAIIESQAKSLAELQEAGPSVSVEVPTVEIDGEEYAVASKKFKLLGDSTEYTAENVLEDAELQKRILAIDGQDILIPAQ